MRDIGQYLTRGSCGAAEVVVGRGNEPMPQECAERNRLGRKLADAINAVHIPREDIQ
jgi:hypothetical protein